MHLCNYSGTEWKLLQLNEDDANLLAESEERVREMVSHFGDVKEEDI